jgi:hypothetical protein
MKIKKRKVMEEYCENWEPLSGLISKYNIDFTEYTINSTFKILLGEAYSQGRNVSVIFKDGIYAHRDTDESFRLSPIQMLRDCGEIKSRIRWTFFKVKNSLYIKWLLEESNSAADSSQLMHFLFAGENSILDVVATYEPIVEFVDSRYVNLNNKKIFRAKSK